MPARAMGTRQGDLLMTRKGACTEGGNRPRSRERDASAGGQASAGRHASADAIEQVTGGDRR